MLTLHANSDEFRFILKPLQASDVFVEFEPAGEVVFELRSPPSPRVAKADIQASPPEEWGA